jgi:dTDP-4-amino-4,6-dideoxygalactose transaminase
LKDKFVDVKFPLAELIASEILSLPIGPHLSLAAIETICANIQLRN